MEKSKPGRSWRVLLTEVGIIVLGVGIALIAQQAVEWLNNRSRVAEARINIRAEIAQNLGAMELRNSTETCTAKRLNEVGVLITAASAGKLPQHALWIGAPFINIMGMAKYNAAVQSGAFSLFEDKEQALYGNFYRDFEYYNRSIEAEMHDWATLRTLEAHPSGSPTLDWELRKALQSARINRWGLQATRLLATRAGNAMGIPPLRRATLKMPDVCVPLQTSRQDALKLIMDPSWQLEPA